MAATRNSTGASAPLHPNTTPLYQAIVLVRCSEHGDHTLLLTGRSEGDVTNTASFIANAMQAAGLTVIVRSHASHRALDDVSVRHPGFDDLCKHMVISSDIGVGRFYSPHEQDVELPF